MLFLRSIRLRLTLWYVFLLALVLAVFCAAVYIALRESLISNLDESVENRAELLLPLVSYDSDKPTLAGIALPGDPESGESFARVFGAAGDVTFDDSTTFGGVPTHDPSVQQTLRGEPSTRTVQGSGETFRARTLPIPNEDGSAVAGVLEVGLNQDDVNSTLHILLLIMLFAYPVTLAIAALGGVLLAGRVLSPIDHLTGLAERISAEDLSRRLNLDLPDDELGRLARTFDAMIARLDDAFRRQRRFTADASHELRTPLTAIKGQAEVALQRDRSPEAYRQTIGAINEEADRLIRLTGSLLSLARADAGQIALSLDNVDVGDIVNSAAEHARPGAAAKNLQLLIEPGSQTTIAADQDLLIQLLLNLLDNAIKYTPDGGRVTVSWELHDDAVSLSVRDTGAGIAPEDIPHIFDRFYRADKARSRAAGGAGLGLSISRWIAEAHGGSISVQSEPEQGATFTVRLPLRRRLDD